MEIKGLENSNLKIDTPLFKAQTTYTEKYPSFGKMLDGVVHNLNALHENARDQVENFTSGGSIDVSQVMISIEKASLATELAVQVRNRMVDGYKEITHMQV